MNWIGFKTLTMREVGRFFSVWRQTIIPGLITSVLYILIFGFTLEKRIESIDGVPYTLFHTPWFDYDERPYKRNFKFFIVHASNETAWTATRYFAGSIIKL